METLFLWHRFAGIRNTLSRILVCKRWDQHRYAVPVRGVLFAMKFEQITLFERDRDQHVNRRPDCKHEMRHGHRRCRPESCHPTDVEWMADQLVRPGCHESRSCVRLALKIKPHLTYSKQIEMVDQQSRREHARPTSYGKGIE